MTDAEVETIILWPPDAETIHWKRPGCWERLKAKGEEDNRGWLDSITNSMPMNLSKLQEIEWGVWDAAVHGVAMSRT